MSTKKAAHRGAPPARRAASTPNQPLWTVIRQYLTENGGRDTILQLTDALVDAGHNLGKYPLRTVKVCVASPHMGQIFEVKTPRGGDETVYLRSTAKEAVYEPWTQRPSQALSKSRRA